MNLNLKGLYFTSQTVAKHMKKQKKGSIINISSIGGITPEPKLSIYSVSKAGVRMITKAFALELAPFNIRINTVSPGHIMTKMYANRWLHLTSDMRKQKSEALEKEIPMGRIGTPDELVGAVVYLASDASSYTTGAEILIDGGVSQFYPMPEN